MRKAKTFARVKRKRESYNILINNKQAKKLALLSILETGYEYANT